MTRPLIALALAAAFGASAASAQTIDLLEAVRAAAEIDPVVAASRGSSAISAAKAISRPSAAA